LHSVYDYHAYCSSHSPQRVLCISAKVVLYRWQTCWYWMFSLFNPIVPGIYHKITCMTPRGLAEKWITMKGRTSPAAVLKSDFSRILRGKPWPKLCFAWNSPVNHEMLRHAVYKSAEISKGSATLNFPTLSFWGELAASYGRYDSCNTIATIQNTISRRVTGRKNREKDPKLLFDFSGIFKKRDFLTCFLPLFQNMPFFPEDRPEIRDRSRR